MLIFALYFFSPIFFYKQVSQGRFIIQYFKTKQTINYFRKSSILGVWESLEYAPPIIYMLRLSILDD